LNYQQRCKHKYLDNIPQIIEAKVNQFHYKNDKNVAIICFMVVANSLKGYIVVTILRIRVDLVFCLNIDFFWHLFIITPNKSSNASLVSIKENLIEAF